MFYVIIHQPTGDTFNTYEGMSQDAVLALISELGWNCTVVDQATYESGVGVRQTALEAGAVSLTLDAISPSQESPVQTELTATVQKLDDLIATLKFKGLI